MDPMLHRESTAQLEECLVVPLHQLIQNRAAGRISQGSVQVIHSFDVESIGKS